MSPPAPEPVEPNTDPTRVAPTPSPASTLAQTLPSQSATARDGAGPALPDYEIERVLGRGGMGVVYLARPRAGGPPVAVKTLVDGLVGSDPARARFRVEADALARLRHPNIVALLGAADGPGAPYLVQEYVPGGSLKDYLTGPLAPGDAAELVEVLARAIHHAHEHGVLHRDLKPGNVLLGRPVEADGTRPPPAALEPKVTDFGLARLTDSEFKQTATGDVLGTPAYMAPEQAAGQTRLFGRPTDVWALGVILYECLTGRMPFQGVSSLEVLDRVRTAEPVPLSGADQPVPRDLEVICLKCLRKEPDKRYPTAGELADDLRRFLEDRPIRARPVGLVERAVKWRRRHPAVAAVGAASVVLALLAVAVALWYWDARLRLKTEHYADVVWHRGVAAGVGRLSAADAGRRALAYRLTLRGGRVLALESVNGAGRPTAPAPNPADPHDDRPEAGRPTAWQFQYAESGEPQTVAAADQFGNPLWALVFTSADRGQFTDPSGRPLDRTASGVTGVAFTWTDRGFPSEVRFLDRNGRPRADDAGVAGYRLEHDPDGRPTRYTCLTRDGTPGWHRAGRYSARARGYDAAGNLTEEAFFDATGKPVVEARFWLSRVQSRHDDAGNVVEQSFFGPDGRPAFCRDGSVRLTRRYDERGNLKEEAYFSASGEPVLGKDNCARFTAEHDARGNVTAENYFDTNGRPTPNRAGAARVLRTYDERDTLTSEAYFDADGSAVASADGFARRTVTHDARGHLTGEAYFDAAGRPTEGPGGIAAWTATVNERGQQLEGCRLGRAGEPVYGRGGYARWRFAYDEQGRLTEQAYFAADGALVAGEDGYARRVLKYDETGFQTEDAYFGVTGKPVPGPEKLARITFARDEHGRKTGVAYFGADGEPVTYGDDKYVRLAFEYDAGGNRNRETSFGADGKPCLNKEGYCRVDYTFNPYGWLVEHRYYDTEGKPALRRGGFSHLVMRYDDRGNRVEEAYYGPDGQLALQAEGFARFVDEYDARGLRTRRSYFGPDGKPARHTSGEWSFTEAYDSAGRVVESRWFGPNGEPTANPTGHAIFRITYDLRGERLEEASFGPGGQPVLCRDGFASRRTRYLPNGLVAEESYHGLAGELIPSKDGPARTTYLYNERRQPIEVACFGPDGRPVLDSGGYARLVQTYDRFGQVVEQQYFGVDGQLRPNANGFRFIRNRYDERGRLIERGGEVKPGVYSRQKLDAAGRITEIAFTDIATGAPVVGPDGFALARMRYDARGELVEHHSFGADGKPAFDKNGVSARVIAVDAIGRKATETVTMTDGLVRLTFNSRGLIVALDYLATDGKPRRGPDGYATTTNRYDAQGNRIEVRYLGPDGLPVVCSEGWARAEFRFDDAGREIERRRYDAAELPTDGRAGYQRFNQRYDAAGRVVEQAWYKADGSPAPMEAGFFRVLIKYDAAGRRRELLGHTAAGQKRIRFDERARIVDAAFFDPAGRPQVQAGGFARETRQYAETGPQCGAAYFGPDDKPVLYQGRFARYAETFGPAGKVATRTEYGTDERPLRRLTYSASGALTERAEVLPGGELRFRFEKELPVESAHFDATGKPALHPDGYARQTFAFDEKGNLTRISYFGLDGKPAATKNGATAVEFEYGPGGQRVARTLAVPGGKQRERLDAEGRVTETALFDDAGKPVSGTNGWHAQRVEYDAAGPKARTYLGADGKQLAVRVAVASVEPKSVAEALGLKAGDVLTEYDGRPVGQVLEFTRRRAAEKDGERELKLDRGGSTITVRAKPGPLGVALEDRVGPR